MADWLPRTSGESDRQQERSAIDQHASVRQRRQRRRARRPAWAALILPMGASPISTACMPQL